MNEGAMPLMQAVRLTRRFGGLTAVNDVSVALQVGQVHAVIGTNGAGKSTLINMMSGELRATSGRIVFAGADITTWPQPARSRAGVGRSYQRTTIFPELSVRENCRLSAQAARQRAWQVWESAARCPHSNAVAGDALERTGLTNVAARAAGLLSHGQKRQLEIAMCLAMRPQVLLLDEPLAGMGAAETDRMLTLLEALKQTHAVLLVEHDMDAVFRVADVITVMVNGEVIASDVPRAIRTHPEVLVAYLGEEH